MPCVSICSGDGCDRLSIIVRGLNSMRGKRKPISLRGWLFHYNPVRYTPDFIYLRFVPRHNIQIQNVYRAKSIPAFV